MGARCQTVWLTDFDRVGDRTQRRVVQLERQVERRRRRRSSTVRRSVPAYCRPDACWGADNLRWVWHVNWLDEPEKDWNRFENYFPGGDYCDWVALSAYGPTTPTMHDGTESFAFKIRAAYARLTRIAPGKPIIIAEFGCDLHNR